MFGILYYSYINALRSIAEVLEEDKRVYGPPTRNLIFMDRALSRTQEETEDASRKILAGMGGNLKKHGLDEEEDEALGEDPFTPTIVGQSDLL